jgi:peptidoglycan/LPS O-acetylase OafA/YrhL
MKRILPISSIRFVLALWVFLSHFPYPILTDPQRNPFLWAARSLLRNSFNGAAAVIAFFVISGFCIHLPNRKRLEIPSWTAYYTRRYLRILIPMGAAIALAVPLKLNFGLYITFILWSLLCEEIYYFIYPLLLRLRDLLGWRGLMSFAWLASFFAILTNPAAKEYHNLGVALTWVLGLPCWLLGARMAERLDTFYSRPISTLQIWLWRGGIWGLTVVVSVLRFHTIVGFPWTLNAFAIVATMWLEREIAYCRGMKGVPVLERLGDASYSVYLTHMHGAMLAGLVIALHKPSSWWLTIVVTVLFSSVFYWAVERPSHQLARRFSQKLAERARATRALEEARAVAGESAT